MIKNQWYAVLDSKQLKKNKLLGVTRLSEKLVFWRDENNEVNCIFDKCCHRGASLSTGKIINNHVECPFHGFQYDSSGKVNYIPANGKNSKVPDRYKVNAYLVKEAYGFIWLWYSDELIDVPEIPFFEELKEGFSYGGFSETWGVHYTRAIENQLDVVHLPFVHKSTIGRGGNTLVNGPVVKWKENLMTFYVKNENDNGQTPEKPNEIQEYDKLFRLQFQMPNIWHNRISDNVRILAAFTPIDDENTHIYLRFYQSFIHTPGLKQIVNWLSTTMNKIILHQDRRVVLTQLPIKSELTMGENLVQGDLPIIEFRKRRDLLKR
ncbi:MAG: aromatic ring-hydroxylating dioxygenase subunit alpha [Dethiosulfatibacter sp.]|nr:aromatic ring-hydroxylating dioxygenase subunit alpha [Dethiosulfatibacter sp.]